MTILDIQTALANEARRQELKFKISALQGAENVTGLLQQRISALNTDSTRELNSLRNELNALNAGAGAGITADFGAKTSLTQLLEAERLAGNSAVIDAIKATPEISEQDAATAWETAAKSAHSTSSEASIQKGLEIGRLYRTRLFSAGVVTEDTWSAFASWVGATPKETILDAT